MKKILITGGSHAEIPLIQAAHDLGYYVVTTGKNEDGPGHKLADKYVSGDFSDKGFVLELARSENVEGIVSGCNDFAYLSTAYACEKLGFRGHDPFAVSEMIHHKNKFRRIAEEAGIRCPKFIECSDLDEILSACSQIGYPLLVKAVDLTGGKGITICRSGEDVTEAFNNAYTATRKKDRFVVEEYISGSNHGASMLLKNKKVTFAFFDDEQYHAGKYLVSGASTTTDIPDSTKETLMSDVEKLAQKLDLTDGLFHVQFIIDGNNYPIMIDPCRRTPGDLYVLLVQYATGINYAMEILKGELAIPLEDSYLCESRNVIRECIMSRKTGIFDHVEIKDSIKDNIEFQMIWAKDGEIIDDVSKYKAGILICRFDSPEESRRTAENFDKYAVIHLKE